MSESLKKGIAAKYLLPIVTAYSGAVGLLHLSDAVALIAMFKSVGAAGLMGLAFLVFQEIVPRSVKEVLVFWRFRDRPPGFRAFSTIAANDNRIDQTELAVLLPSTPMSPKEENTLWYRWLKSVESDPAIADNHHRFLALRDCAVLLFLLAIVSPLVAFWSLPAASSAVYLTSATFLAYCLVAVAARNAATRLVGNVIAKKVATA